MPVLLLFPGIALLAASLEALIYTTGRSSDSISEWVETAGDVGSDVERKRKEELRSLLMSNVIGAWAMKKGWADVPLDQIGQLRWALRAA